MLPISSVDSFRSQFPIGLCRGCSGKLAIGNIGIGSTITLATLVNRIADVRISSWSKSKIILYNLAWIGLTIIDHLCYIIHVG